MENYKHYSTLKKTLKELLDSHNNWYSDGRLKNWNLMLPLGLKSLNP